MVEASLAATE